MNELRVLVTGCGQSGTNWVTEIVRCSPEFKFISQAEDRELFRRGTMIKAYGTKLAIEWYEWKDLGELINLSSISVSMVWITTILECTQHFFAKRNF